MAIAFYISLVIAAMIALSYKLGYVRGFGAGWEAAVEGRAKFDQQSREADRCQQNETRKEYNET